MACDFYGNPMSSGKVALAIPGCELAPISAYSPINGRICCRSPIGQEVNSGKEAYLIPKPEILEDLFEWILLPERALS